MPRSTRSVMRRIARREKVSQFFDLEIDQIERGRRHLRIESDKGEFELRSSRREEGFLIFLYSAQEHLKTQGFDRFFSVHQSRDAFPYVKYRRHLLVLKDTAETEEFTYTPENIKNAFITLAKFHLAARGLDPMPGSEFKVAWGKWPDRCFQEVNDLVKLKLFLKERHQSTFDKLFLTQVDYFIERGLKAWQRFNHDHYRQVLKEEMEARAFNLHSYKAKRLAVIEDQIMITDMNRIRFELQVHDVAVFINDVLQHSDLTPQEVGELLRYYIQVRPLNSREWESFEAFLLYPKDMYRLIRHYHTKRKMEEVLERFEEQTRLLERQDQLLTHLNR